jgi:hypothetical protein
MNLQTVAPFHRGPIERRADFEWRAVDDQQLAFDRVAVLHLGRKHFPAVDADGKLDFTHGRARFVPDDGDTYEATPEQDALWRLALL